MKTTLRIALTLVFCLALLLCLTPAGNCAEPTAQPINANAVHGTLYFRTTPSLTDPVISAAETGSAVYITCVPDSGYILDVLQVTSITTGTSAGLLISPSGDYFFYMPEGGVEVSAVFKNNASVITFVVEPPGTSAKLSINDTELVIQGGSGKTFSLAPGTTVIVESVTEGYGSVHLTCSAGIVSGNYYTVPNADATVTITITGGIPIDEEHFPDAAFRAFVAENFDTVKNDLLDDAEIEAITNIFIQDANVRSLQGIEYFHALKELSPRHTSIAELDLSKNTALETVHGSWNEQLVSVCLGENAVLSLLHFPNSPIPELDISGCPLIVDAYLNGEEKYPHYYISNKGDLLVNEDTTVIAVSWIASGQCGDNLFWYLDKKGCLVIYGTGQMYDYDWNNNRSPWAAYEDKIQSVLIEEGVTSIGSFAFSTSLNGYPHFTEISLAHSLRAIGDSAFARCTALEEIELPEGITAVGVGCFSSCRKLASVSLPSTLTKIETSAFLSCASLSNIIIPQGVTKIGWQAFYECRSLHYIFIPDTIECIEVSAFGNAGLTHVDLPASVSDISSSAFSNCQNLSWINVDSFNNNYCSLDGVLFSKDMSKLYCYPAGKSGEYVIPSGVTSVLHSAFSGAVGLSGILIPNTVTSIDNYAFSSCSGLTEIILPDSIDNLGESVFSGCTALIRAKLSNSLTLINDGTFRNCSNLTDISFPVSITVVGTAAFSDCVSLTDVYYGGTEELWNGLEYRNGFLPPSPTDGNAPLRNAYIHFGVTYYTVSFDTAMNSRLKKPGEALPLPDWYSTPSAYFVGWAEHPNAAKPDYPMPGSSYTRDEDVALYAVWVYPDLIPPSAITVIGEEAFAGGAFRFPKLPEKEISIGSRAFADCPNLTCIYIHDKITDIADDAFGDSTDIVILGGEPSQGVKSAAEIYAEAHGFRFVSVYFHPVIYFPATSGITE